MAASSTPLPSFQYTYGSSIGTPLIVSPSGPIAIVSPGSPITRLMYGVPSLLEGQLWWTEDHHITAAEARESGVNLSTITYSPGWSEFCIEVCSTRNGWVTRAWRR